MFICLLYIVIDGCFCSWWCILRLNNLIGHNHFCTYHATGELFMTQVERVSVYCLSRLFYLSLCLQVRRQPIYSGEHRLAGQAEQPCVDSNIIFIWRLPSMFIFIISCLFSVMLLHQNVFSASYFDNWILLLCVATCRVF